jgi:hypothetical protein
VGHKFNTMDKRTKEYKDWLKSQETEGLGDVVENVLEKTGIAKVAKFLLGEDCGCEERKIKLNQMFPSQKPLCLEEEEYNFLTEYFEKDSKTVKIQEQRDLLKIYNRVFRQKNARETSSCASCVREMVAKLRRVYNEYKLN